MAAKERGGLAVDPRAGLFLLVAANGIAFSEKPLWVEWCCIAGLCLLLAVCGCLRAAVKFCLGFCLLAAFQRYVLPVSPKLIATSFSIFANYARRMFPCLMVGTLMVKTIPLRTFLVGLRRLHLPQKLIIPIAVTLRYFPAIREETGHIRDAMRLRSIRGLQRVEAVVVPLMLCATETAEELSAAAVTRGIENPAPKTSLIRLRPGLLDGVCCLAAAALLAAALFA